MGKGEGMVGGGVGMKPVFAGMKNTWRTADFHLILLLLVFFLLFLSHSQSFFFLSAFKVNLKFLCDIIFLLANSPGQ